MSLQAPVTVTVTEVTADVSAATLGVSVYLQARDGAARSATPPTQCERKRDITRLRIAAAAAASPPKKHEPAGSRCVCT